GPGPPSVARCTGQCAGRDDGRDAVRGHTVKWPPARIPARGLGGERPAPLRGAGSRPCGAATWRGPRFMPAAPPPPRPAAVNWVRGLTVLTDIRRRRVHPSPPGPAAVGAGHVQG